MPHGGSFIFLDPGGRRWPLVRRITLICATALAVAVILFFRALFVTPELRLPAPVIEMKNLIKALQVQGEAPRPEKPLWIEFSRGRAGGEKWRETVVAREKSEGIVLGFYAGWDPRAKASFSAHGDGLTHVSPEWFTLVDGKGGMEIAGDDGIRALAAEKGVVLMPVLANLYRGAWLPEAVEGLANGPVEVREGFVSRLADEIESLGAGGVVVEWGEIDPAYRDRITTLLAGMADALHQGGKELWLSVPMGLELRAYDLDALSPVVDRFVARLHDENSENDRPGPIASQGWVEGWSRTMSGYGSPGQWIICLGSYGYDWKEGERAETLAFQDVMARAGRAGIRGCGGEEPLYSPHFSYDEAGSRHQVWFLDVATFLNNLISARGVMTGGVAVFRLGTEDPAVWKAIAMAGEAVSGVLDPAPLSAISPGEAVSYVGNGEFLTAGDERRDGFRILARDASGRFSCQYEAFPGYMTIFRHGTDDPDAVAITFDDGPDPAWTPRILDILGKEGVKAAFFVLGSKAEENPDLLRRIVAEGHALGVHTYTHPDLSRVTDERLLLELNATQRIIEAITGRSTILFRPPYSDCVPVDAEQFRPFRMATDLGYLTVSYGIDPEDWSIPGVETLIDRVKLERREGRVLLLHDAGGDREETMAALPAIIRYLRARGDRIVPLNDLLGVSLPTLMPQVQAGREPFTRFISGAGFRIWHAFEGLFWAFLVAATILVLFRASIVTIFAVRNRYGGRSRTRQAPPTHPVSVVMPAFNEERVIRETLLSVIDTDYPGDMEVVVVDDGSSDATAEKVEDLASADPRIRLLRQPNLGKAAALGRAFEAARHDILVTLDADTRFQRDTISRLVQGLSDPRVGAVSGNARVGNERSFMARLQSLEYICGFNLDRRAYHEIDCITVVPGAVSAMRKDAVARAGGISADTLAEDTDLTLCLHREGFRVAHAPDAIAWTEAPEDVRSLARQRFRWGFGTLQCLWKHRDMVFNPGYGALGLFGLPSVWFFHVFLVALGPILDLMLVLSLFLGPNPALYLYTGVFFLTDAALSCLAIRMEGEPLKKTWLAFPMRLVYRTLLGVVMWRVLIRAAKGAWVGWEKLDRTASVSMDPAGGLVVHGEKP